MSEKTFEGTTMEAALEAAAKELGAAVSDLDHEVVEKKEDFWGMGDATVVIKAWRRDQPVADAEKPGETAPQQKPVAAGEPAGASPEAPEGPTPSPSEPTPAGAESSEEPVEAEQSASPAEQDAPEEAEQSASPAEEGAHEADDTPVQGRKSSESGAGGTEDVQPGDVHAFLEQIFHDMEFECTVEVAAEDEGFLATIDGADKDALLEGNGRCLSALELLANNAFRHKLPRGNKVRVDAGDFRNKRDEELSNIAFQVAHSAKESGRTQETQPLNPYERRLVHLALAEDPAVTTRSRGSGFLKNVQVIPSSGGGNRTRGRRG